MPEPHPAKPGKGSGRFAGNPSAAASRYPAGLPDGAKSSQGGNPGRASAPFAGRDAGEASPAAAPVASGSSAGRDAGEAPATAPSAGRKGAGEASPAAPGTPPASKSDLTQGSIPRHMARMAMPMMIGMTAHLLLNLIDGILVGRLGIDESLAVLNYGFPFFYLLFAFFNGIGTGTTSILSRLLGAGEIEKAENTLSQLVWIALGLFALMAALTPLVLPVYLHLQKAPAASAALAGQYLLFMFLGLPFTVISLILGGGLRAEGNMRTLMNAMLLGTLGNILIAPFLIFDGFRLFGMRFPGTGLGVVGAGLATSASALFIALVIGALYFRGRTRIAWRRWPAWNDIAGVKAAFAVGFPSIASQALIGLNLIILTRLATPFGPTAAAAIGIGARLDVLAVFPALSIMVAVLSLVGQNHGAGRHDRVRRTVRTGLVAAFVSVGLIGMAAFFCRGALVGFFDPLPETEAAAVHFFGLLTLGYGFVGMSIVASGAFQGLGRGMPFLFINLLRLVILAAPLAWLFGRLFGEYGMHYAPLAAGIITGMVACLWILSATRRHARSSPLREA